jgi:hypothetical protein
LYQTVSPACGSIDERIGWTLKWPKTRLEPSTKNQNNETMHSSTNRARFFHSGGEQESAREIARKTSAQRHFRRAAELFPARKV